jgi:hypothetical protein
MLAPIGTGAEGLPLAAPRICTVTGWFGAFIAYIATIFVNL